MKHKQQLSIVTVIVILVLAYIASVGIRLEFIEGSCIETQRSLLRCIDIVLFEKHQALSLVAWSMLISLLPLFFTKSHVYRAWRTFALVAVPVVALCIFLAPVHAPGAWITLGYDREFAAMFFSGLFLLISWILIAYKTYRR